MLRGSRRALRGVRFLGSWASEIEATRGASIEARKALAAKLQDAGAWTVGQDILEARRMEVEAGTAPNSQFAFVLDIEGTTVGIMRAALVQQTTAMLIDAQCDPALCMSSIGAPLIQAAREELKLRGAERVVAVAPLPGLCKWIASEAAWDRLDSGAPDFAPDQPGAVEAVAKGIPRPGHSVLGVGTFKAAEPAFKRLAMEYAATKLTADGDAEVAMFVTAGAEVMGINWMHAQSEEALRDCAGCTVTLRFPGFL